MPAKAVAASRRADRRAAASGRPATQMTQPAVCSAHPERDSSRVDRLAQCESRPEHGVEPPEPAGPGGGAGIQDRNAGLFCIPALPATTAEKPDAAWSGRNAERSAHPVIPPEQRNAALPGWPCSRPLTDGHPERVPADSWLVQRGGGEQAGFRSAMLSPSAPVAAGVVGARVCEPARARVTWTAASAAWIRPRPAEGLKKLICMIAG